MIIFDIVIIFGPVMGYISQYKLIQQNNSVGNFSIDICAILLISNILRIYFWYAHGFGLPLLFQSFLMIIAQIMLLRICVNIKRQKLQLKQQQDSERNIMNPGFKNYQQSFWRWNRFKSYIKFLIFFTLILAMMTIIFYTLLQNQQYGVIIGYLSTCLEAALGFPQLIQNFRLKSVEGLSLFLIMTWFIGDLGKTIYFIFDKQPFQFIVCGIIQLSVDIIIVIQMIIFRKKFEPYDPIELEKVNINSV